MKKIIAICLLVSTLCCACITEVYNKPPKTFIANQISANLINSHFMNNLDYVYIVINLQKWKNAPTDAERFALEDLYFPDKKIRNYTDSLELLTIGMLTWQVDDQNDTIWHFCNTKNDRTLTLFSLQNESCYVLCRELHHGSQEIDYNDSLTIQWLNHPDNRMTFMVNGHGQHEIDQDNMVHYDIAQPLHIDYFPNKQQHYSIFYTMDFILGINQGAMNLAWSCKHETIPVKARFYDDYYEIEAFNEVDKYGNMNYCH